MTNCFEKLALGINEKIILLILVLLSSLLVFYITPYLGLKIKKIISLIQEKYYDNSIAILTAIIASSVLIILTNQELSLPIILFLIFSLGLLTILSHKDQNRLKGVFIAFTSFTIPLLLESFKTYQKDYYKLKKCWD